MREIVFNVLPRSDGRLRARSEHPPLAIEAGSFEELQHEAREALIQQLGASHVAYRVRIQRPSSRIRPLHRSLPPGRLNRT
ncbi:MAG: hypothetical protein ACKO0M_09515 [Cyanobium sp.]